MIPAETDDEANELIQHIIDGADEESFDGLKDAKNTDKEGSTAQKIMNDIFIAPTIVGSPETIVKNIEKIDEETDIDGIIFAFHDFIEDMKFFEAKILPLLDERDLRNKVMQHIAK
jgi:pyrimidine oxygenase